MPSNPRIRERLDEDLPTLGRVLVRVHELDGYPVEGVQDPEGWCTPERLEIAWVALDQDGEPVGQVVLSRIPEKKVLELARFFLDPRSRGQGLGYELMCQAQAYASERGYRLTLEVIDKDQAAIALYEATGWRMLGYQIHIASGRGLQALVYEWRPAQNGNQSH